LVVIPVEVVEIHPAVVQGEAGILQVVVQEDVLQGAAVVENVP
jgi:hypothetical protein